MQQALNHRLIPGKVYAVKKIKQIKRLESFISSKIYFKTIAENDFEKDVKFLSSNLVFGKSIQCDKNKNDVCMLRMKRKEK